MQSRKNKFNFVGEEQPFISVIHWKIVDIAINENGCRLIKVWRIMNGANEFGSSSRMMQNSAMSEATLHLAEEIISLKNIHTATNLSQNEETILEQHLNNVIEVIKYDSEQRRAIFDQIDVRNCFESLSTISNPTILSSLLTLSLLWLEDNDEIIKKNGKTLFLFKNLLESLQSLLLNFPTDSVVVVNVCRILSKLLSSLEDFNISDKFIAQVIKALRANLGDEDCVIEINHVLLKSANSPASLCKICIILEDLPFRVLQLHENNMKVISSTLHLLSQLTLDNFEKLNSMKCGITKSLTHFTRLYGGKDKAVAAASVRIIMNLAAGSFIRAITLGEDGMCELVLEVGREYHNDELVQIVVCDCLLELIFTEGRIMESNRSLVLHHKGLHLLLEGIRKGKAGTFARSIYLLKALLVVVYLCKPFSSNSLSAESEWKDIIDILTALMYLVDNKYLTSVLKLVLWLVEDDFAKDKIIQYGLHVQLRKLFLESKAEEAYLQLFLKSMKQIATTSQGLRDFAVDEVLVKLCTLLEQHYSAGDTELVKEIVATLKILSVHMDAINVASLRSLIPVIVSIISNHKKNMKLADETFRLYRKLSKSQEMKALFKTQGIAKVLKDYNIIKYLMECVLDKVSVPLLVVLLVVLMCITVYIFVHFGWIHCLVLLLVGRLVVMYIL